MFLLRESRVRLANLTDSSSGTGLPGCGLHDRWHPMKVRGTSEETCKNQ